MIPKATPQPDNRVGRAWPSGPLRLTGSGSASKYVCEICRYTSPGVYRTSKGWLCAGCREAGLVSEVRPSRIPAVAASKDCTQPLLAFAT